MLLFFRISHHETSKSVRRRFPTWRWTSDRKALMDQREYFTFHQLFACKLHLKAAGHTELRKTFYRNTCLMLSVTVSTLEGKYVFWTQRRRAEVFKLLETEHLNPKQNFLYFMLTQHASHNFDRTMKLPIMLVFYQTLCFCWKAEGAPSHGDTSYCSLAAIKHKKSVLIKYKIFKCTWCIF